MNDINISPIHFNNNKKKKKKKKVHGSPDTFWGEVSAPSGGIDNAAHGGVRENHAGPGHPCSS
jgi:hypothetical protein